MKSGARAKQPPRAPRPKRAASQAVPGDGDVFLNVGRVQVPYGLTGAVGILPLTDSPERWQELQRVSYLADDGRHYLEVESAHLHSGKVIAKFKGYDVREVSAALTGRFLQVPRSESPALPAGSYWMADLVGLQVVTADEQPVGTVQDVLQAGNDLLQVLTAAGKEILIPMVRTFVQAIDLEGRKVVVTPIPGLLDQD